MKRNTDFSKTKIIGTIGPATNKPEIIADMIRAGLDVARLNFSHGSYEEHSENIKIIRKGAELAESPIAILADLCGPKIRLGIIEQEFEIESGENVVISTDPDKYSGNLKMIRLIINRLLPMCRKEIGSSLTTGFFSWQYRKYQAAM